jgi:hypothetical protein
MPGYYLKIRPRLLPSKSFPIHHSHIIKRSRGVTLTTHPHLVPRSIMSRSYTSSPPSAFVACSGTDFSLHYWKASLNKLLQYCGDLMVPHISPQYCPPRNSNGDKFDTRVVSCIIYLRSRTHYHRRYVHIPVCTDAPTTTAARTHIHRRYVHILVCTDGPTTIAAM